MKNLLLIFAVLFPELLGAATWPNYFVTNATPFDVSPGASIYVPTLYSTNVISTNTTVTDYLFIGTAQVNYLTMLGAINQQGVTYTNYFQADTNYFNGDIRSKVAYSTNVVLANSTNFVPNAATFGSAFWCSNGFLYTTCWRSGTDTNTTLLADPTP